MTKDSYSILFEPFKLKSVSLRNRIVVPPMKTNRDVVGPDGIEWYRNLARGGAGLVIVEPVPVNWFKSRLSVDVLRRLRDAVHEEGAGIVHQIWMVTEENMPLENISISEIEKIKNLFAIAARKCQSAGFDGIELHGAHRTLLNQFFFSKNPRKDIYGGSLTNRMRMGIEIVSTVRDAVEREFLIFYRHTPCEEDDYAIDESIIFVKGLIESGLDVIDISPASDKEPADLSEPIKKAVDIPVIAVGKMDEDNRAVTALQKNRADLIAIGRGLIADYEWPNKVKEGRFSEIVKCEKCNEKCYGNLPKRIPIECVQWKEKRRRE